MKDNERETDRKRKRREGEKTKGTTDEFNCNESNGSFIKLRASVCVCVKSSCPLIQMGRDSFEGHQFQWSQYNN